MTKQKAKFELYQRLQNLGFTYEEAAQLRRIEMTLQRWAEAECGDSNDFCSKAIERDETTGKPFQVIYHHSGLISKASRYPIADREAGALRRLKAIVDARNARKFPNGLSDADCHPDFVFPYHQSDPRGCAVYLVRTSDFNGQSIDQVYNRGLAVCA